MNDRGSNGTGSWQIKVWPYTAKLTNVIVTSFGESSNLVSKSKMFVKDEAKVSSRVGGVEWRVVYFGKLVLVMLLLQSINRKWSITSLNKCQSRLSQTADHASKKARLNLTSCSSLLSLLYPTQCSHHTSTPLLSLGWCIQLIQNVSVLGSKVGWIACWDTTHLTSIRLIGALNYSIQSYTVLHRIYPTNIPVTDNWFRHYSYCLTPKKWNNKTVYSNLVV